jgi:hypothetical protein
MALIQPVCAPTGIDCSVALPHSIPLVHPLQLCVAGISDGAAIAGRSCRASKFDSWARLGGIEVGTRCEGPAGRPAGQAGKRAGMQAGRQTGRQADRQTGRAASQPASQPTNQPASQPAKGLTSTPDCLTQPPSALSTPLQISLIF